MIGSRLTSVTVEGYTSIRSARVELGRLNVLVGPNGAGKSNFVNALELLGRIANDDLQLFADSADNVTLAPDAANLTLHNRPEFAFMRLPNARWSTACPPFGRGAGSSALTAPGHHGAVRQPWWTCHHQAAATSRM
ncbi:AAA family ATPase [Frankia sp. Cas4]|uniref:AAA family ATPase n=1 Tax=Frankia sp. Cas4 TaxID=3073927 RepID=UPI002AD2BBF7|nr:AAA family ATPase [Frankia sp. Cas4]